MGKLGSSEVSSTSAVRSTSSQPSAREPTVSGVEVIIRLRIPLNSSPFTGSTLPMPRASEGAVWDFPHPCQTCLPQVQGTVSVGTFFVSCCLQNGQGFVITYVIARTPVKPSRHPLPCTLSTRRPLNVFRSKHLNPLRELWVWKRAI